MEDQAANYDPGQDAALVVRTAKYWQTDVPSDELVAERDKIRRALEDPHNALERAYADIYRMNLRVLDNYIESLENAHYK